MNWVGYEGGKKNGPLLLTGPGGFPSSFSLSFLAFFYFLHVILHVKSKKEKKKVRKSRERAFLSLLFLNFFLSRVPLEKKGQFGAKKKRGPSTKGAVAVVGKILY